ncbi:two-component sensor histidine kinase [Rhodanobacter sp. B04]|uniref:ATP-binding protein n=1 Tax=Rhodanobacter sp. B04 TaxID=1945860 RepID=UPI000984DE3B|nr:ATP-binding protein [Rhodanobacter sp. B04]OOG63425.1 two-component sensor histidine kinase [Rhodanobacter sp. B04]
MKTASLRTRLTWLIIAVQIGVLIPLGVLSYQRELREMDQLLDGRLAQAGRTVGALLAQAPASLATDSPDAALPAEALRGAVLVRVHKHNYEPEVGFQAYTARGKLLAATSNFSELAAPLAEERGFRDIDLQDQTWRTFTLQNQAGLVIRIGERYDNRREITRALVMEHSLPLFIGLPLLALLASLAVKRGLRPLALLAEQLGMRTPGSRQPIAVEHTPREITPLVVTLNQQLGRLEDTIEREHRFASDVAHELRTPLTATMIHLESAQLADDPREIEFTLQSAQQSLARLARRVEQILALARLEAGAASQQRVRLDLVSLATEVIEELAPVIADKDIALSLNHDMDALWVQGHEAALTSMFRNLIENALRYTQQAGRVEVSIEQHGNQVTISICDDGPGIPAERRDVVFERFHRAAETESRGYGLGLSIVQRAVELHDARIELLASPYGQGLQVRIHMLAASA